MDLAKSGMRDRTSISQDVKALDSISKINDNDFLNNYLGVNLGNVYKARESLKENQTMRDSDPFSVSSVSNKGVSWNIAFMDSLLRKESYVLNAVNYKSVKTMINGIDLNIRKHKDKKENINVAIEINDKIEMNYRKAMIRFAFLGIAHGGAGNLIVVDNVKNKEELLTPLTPNDIKKGSEIHLRPLTRLYQIQPDYSRQDKYIQSIGEGTGIYDSTELGKPKYYRISISGDMFGEKNGKYSFNESNNFNTFLVHRSRLMIFNSSELSWIEEQIEQFFGLSIIEKALDPIKRYKQTLDEMMKLLVRSNIPVIYIESMVAQARMGDAGLNKIDEALLSYEYAIRTGEAMVMGENEKFEYIQANFQHLNEQLTAREREVSSALKTHMSVTFNSKDENEESFYYYDIENIQEMQIRPALMQLLPLLYKSMYGEEIPDYSFTFRSLEATTEKEKAEKLKIVTEIIVNLFEANMITVGSARDMLISASDNISDMLYELNNEFERQLGNDDKLYKDFQIEISNELQTAALKHELQGGDKKYNMAESKVKGQNQGGNPKTTTKKPIDIKV